MEPNTQDAKFCAKCMMVLTYDAYSETLEKQQEKDSEIQTLKDQMRSMQTIVASFGKLMNDKIDSISVEDSRVFENRLFDQATKKQHKSNTGHTYVGNLKRADCRREIISQKRYYSPFPSCLFLSLISFTPKSIYETVDAEG